MQADPVAQALENPSGVRTLRWQVPLKQVSYACPFKGCGELVKIPLDSPPRSFRELSQALITKHFMGQCDWCFELAPTGAGRGHSEVGCIEMQEPATGVVMLFYVFVKDKEWHCRMWSPVDTDMENATEVLKLQQNPLFAATEPVPDSTALLHDLGCAELVMSALHPCIREALKEKDRATREVLESTARLQVAATVLMYATNMHLPAAIGDAHTCTELAVIANKDAVSKWYAANASIVQRLEQHTPASSQDLQLFQEYTAFVNGLPR